MTAQWLDWQQACSLPVGTALRIDSASKRHRLTGRIVQVDGDGSALHLVDRRLVVRIVTTEHFLRARIVDSLFQVDDTGFQRGTGKQIYVIATDGTQVQVESHTGPFWLDETQIEHSDDRAVTTFPGHRSVGSARR